MSIMSAQQETVQAPGNRLAAGLEACDPCDALVALHTMGVHLRRKHNTALAAVLHGEQLCPAEVLECILAADGPAWHITQAL